ncbi:ABC transporter permease [Deinococcus radiophilus]|uniref:ABC transporter permease n=1 Tax=Deinococcus radiophilus TaxID=32062 RepID=A0A3S0JQT4_9DEIO|nr:ABC transporter permease [Deinococcus radiophilus]RTR27038.1 ABC transporter permease [Deinococcus radiophilus]UFA50179.1 ABC transporter permease [Deinococcus radiophilus]
MNRSRPAPIVLLGAALGLLALLLPWVSFRENRLVQGEGLNLLTTGQALAWLLPSLWVALGAAALWLQRGRGWVGTVLFVLICAAASMLLGGAALALVNAEQPLARVSPAGGFWLTVAALYVTGFGVSRWAQGPARWAGWLGAAAFALMPLVGWWRELGLAQEYANIASAFWPQLGMHLALSLTALLLALILGLPLGLAAARNERLSGGVLGVAGFLQTIPSVALFGLLLPVFAALGRDTTLGAYLTWAGGALLLGGLLQRFFGHRLLGLLGGLLGLLGVQALLLLIGLTVIGVLERTWSGAPGLGAAAWSLGAPLSTWGIRGIGAAPALLALTIYALLPIVTNTFVGLRSVPPGLIDAARGLGMTPGQILRRAEWPIALPFVMEGVRAALVLTFGITTIAPLIGAGGLGFFIQRGVEGNVPDLVLLGALPIVLIALLLSGVVAWLGERLTPPGLRAEPEVVGQGGPI